MYVYGRGYVNAGTNEFYRWGKKAQAKLRSCLIPNEQGFYTIPTETKEWTIGTSEGKYGEFAKFGDTFISVNSRGNAWAKAGTPKAEVFIKMVNTLLKNMEEMLHPVDDEEEEIEEEF